MLDGRAGGKKCMRVSTGEVVAAWAVPDLSARKKGKVAFLGDRGMLGEGFEVLCLVSLLAVWERERRNRRSKRNKRNGVASVR